MYVCICNALTDRDVARAREAGCAEPDEVFAFHGTAVQCGRCVPAMEEALDAAAWAERRGPAVCAG